MGYRGFVRIEAPSVAAPLNENSSLHEWLADPVGWQVLIETYGDEGNSSGCSPTST